jgi:hypothetical protein
MKKITFLIAFMLSVIAVGYGQDVTSYTRTPLTGLTYTPIAGGTVINTNAGLTVGGITAPTQDDGVALVTLPFTFTYAGNTFTQATFATNGWVGLGNQTAVTDVQSRASGNLFTAALPNNTLAPWFGDLGANFPTGNGSMVHGSIGTDVYAFEWRNAVANGFSQNNNTNVINFMVVIYGPASTAPGRIEFLYGSTIGTVSTSRAIGIEDATGGIGHFVNAVNGSSSLTTTATAWPGAGKGYRFETNTTPCTGTPVVGAIEGLATRVACSGVSPDVIYTAGTTTTPSPGVVYQWEQSTDGGTSWANVTAPSANTAYLIPPAFAGTSIKYRLRVTCTNSNESVVSGVVTLNPTPAPTTQATALAVTATQANLVATWTNGNGTRRMVIVSTSPIVDPVNQQGVAAPAVSSVFANTGQQVVYDGTGTTATVTVTGIACGVTYYVKVFEYERCGSIGAYTYTYNTTNGTNTATATVAPLAAPTTQATALNVTTTYTNIVATWTNGSTTTRRMVLVSTSPIVDPQNGPTTAPTVSTVFANAGQQVVYDGTGTTATVTITGVTCGTTYYVKVIEYARCGSTTSYEYAYNNTTGTNAATAVVSPLVAPATQASNLKVASAYTSATLTWTNGNGARRIVLIGEEPITDPANESGPVPVGTAAYANGGQQIVYEGTGSTVTVTGLTCGNTYYFKVLEYDRCGTAVPYDMAYNTTIGTNVATITGPATTTVPTTNNFTGFTGTNLSTAAPGWFEAAIPTVAGNDPTSENPEGTTSAWTSSTVFTTTTAKVNLYAATKNEFIISPKMAVTAATRVRFKAAITNFGSGAADTERMQATDDAVNVLYSTDGCGETWNLLYIFNAATTQDLTNVLTDYSFELPASVIGETVQIAFQATEGPIDHTPDYDFHIGNIVVELAPLCDTPVAVAISNPTENGATVSFNVPLTGTPTGYQYVVSTTNTAPTGAGTPVTGTTFTVNTLPSSTTHYVFVRSVCGGGSFSAWTQAVSFTTLCDAPDIVTTVPASICGLGSAQLTGTASAGGELYWFDAATGGAVLASGNAFTTPQISATTTYYVSAASGTPNTDVQVGAGASTSSTYSNPLYSSYSNNHTQHLIKASELLAAGIGAGPINSLALNVTSAGTLPTLNMSIKIGASSATAMTAFTSNSGFATVYTSASYMPTVGVNTFTFTTPFVWDGTSNIVVEFCHGNPASTATMSRTIKTDVTTFVSTIKSHITTEPGTAGSVICGDTTSNLTTYSARPQFIFNGTSLCFSPRQAVVATVTAPVAVTATASSPTVCAGNNTTLTAASTNSDYTYVWTPGNLTGPSVSVSPTATTTYTVTATDAVANCVATQTVVVTVVALPGLDITAPATACANSIVTLSVSPSAYCTPSANTTPDDSGDYIKDFTFAGISNLGSNDAPTDYTYYSNLTANVVAGSSYPVKFVAGGTTSLYAQQFAVWIDYDQNGIFEATEFAYASTTATTSSTPTEGTITIPATAANGTTRMRVASRYSSAITAGQSCSTGTSTFGEFEDYNITITGGAASPTYTWSPAAGLFTDAAATIPYTGGAASTVYAKPSATVTYTASVTNSVTTCTGTDSATITVTTANAPTGAATQIVTVSNPADATIEDIVTNETGVVWYATLADAVAGTQALPAGTVLTNGLTYYGVLTSGNCRSTALPVTVDVVLGKESFDIASFTYYPNPVQDVLNLTYSQDITSVSVFNLLGQRVIAKEVNATEAKVDMSGLADGTYIVNVTAGNTVKTLKVVKKQ